MFKKVLIIGDSCGVPNYYGPPGVEHFYHTEYMLKNAGLDVINCALNNGSNIESIEKAFSYLEGKSISTRPDTDTKTVNDGKPVDLIIWFHTDLLRDYYRLSPGEKIEPALSIISHHTYNLFAKLLHKCDCLSAVIGGLSPLRQEMYEYFQSEFLISDWKSKLVKKSLPSVQSMTRLDVIESSPDTLDYKLDLIKKHEIITNTLRDNKEYFPDDGHPGIIPHKNLSQDILNFLKKYENLTKEDCVIELPFLQYDKSILVDCLDSVKSWSSAYPPSESLCYCHPSTVINHSFNVKKAIENLLDTIQKQMAYIRIKSSIFIQLKPNTIVNPHIDMELQKFALMIPLKGEMDLSPLIFHSKKPNVNKNIVYKHTYKHPVIINPKMWHSSHNLSASDRHLYRINFDTDKSWEEIRALAKTL